MGTATGGRDYGKAAQLVALLVLGAGLLGPAREQWPRAFQEALGGFPTDPPFDETKAVQLAALGPTGTHAIPLPRLFVPAAEATPQGTPDAADWHKAVASQLAPAPQDRPILTLAGHDLYLGDTRAMSVAALPPTIEEGSWYPYPYSYSYTMGDRSLSFMLRDLTRFHGSYAGQMLRTRLARADSLLAKVDALHRASLADLQAYVSGQDRAPENLDPPHQFGLRVLVPGDTTYQTWLALLDTAAGAGAGQYFLLTEGPALSPAPGAIRWGYGSWEHSHCFAVETMLIDLLVLPEGVALRTDEGPIGPGCTAGEGLTFPREPASPTALADCIRKLDDARPDVRHYHNAIWADPALPVHRIYETLLLLQPLLRSRHDREDHAADGLVASSHDGVFSDYPRLLLSTPTSVEEWQRHPVLPTAQGVMVSRPPPAPVAIKQWNRPHPPLSNAMHAEIDRQLDAMGPAMLEASGSGCVTSLPIKDDPPLYFMMKGGGLAPRP